MARVLLLLAALPGLAAAQLTVSYAPQPASRVRSLTEWGVRACAVSAVTVSGGLLYQEAAKHFRPVLRSRLQELLTEQERRSPLWLVPLAGKLLGVGWTALQASNRIRLKDAEQYVAPASTVVFEAVDIAVRRNTPSTALPDDLVPPVLQLSAGQCGEWRMYGVAQAGEEAWQAALP